jgi:restriction endonuclease BglII
MRICDSFEHRNAMAALRKRMPFEEIAEIIEVPELRFGRDTPKHMKDVVSERFNGRGWADRVRIVPGANLTVNFMKNRVAACFQLGNVARIYADLLKLESMGLDHKIDVGLVMLPDAIESAKLGANYARFDRLKKEMKVYSRIFSLPLLILSLSN